MLLNSHLFRLADRLHNSYNTLRNKSVQWQLPTSRRFDKANHEHLQHIADIILANKESGAWRDLGYRLVRQRLAAEPYKLNIPEYVLLDREWC